MRHFHMRLRPMIRVGPSAAPRSGEASACLPIGDCATRIPVSAAGIRRLLLAVAFLSGTLHGAALAGGGWDDLEFLYTFEGGSAQDLHVGTPDFVGCLDGEWRRSSAFDRWDGSSPDPADGAPGGIGIDYLPEQGEDGGATWVLSLEDPGDPRMMGFQDPCNQSLFLWRDTTHELDLAEGVTLSARWRLDAAPRWLQLPMLDIPVPNGSTLHGGGLGQIGFVQLVSGAGTRPATLGLALTGGETLQYAWDFGNGVECRIPPGSAERCLPVQDGAWVSVWLTAKEVQDGIALRIFLDGAPEPLVDEVLEDVPDGVIPGRIAETDGSPGSYIFLATGVAPGDAAAFQVDYVRVAPGVHEPSHCPHAARVRVEGGSVVIRWMPGRTAPSSLEVLRDGVLIASGVSPEPQFFVDRDQSPGDHVYDLLFQVPGTECPPLTTSISACPQALAAAPTPQGVWLRWENPWPLSPLWVLRDGTVIAVLTGETTSFLDLGAPVGMLTYGLVPSGGTCPLVETSVRNVAAVSALGDFGGVEAAWAYSLDPPQGARAADFLRFDGPDAAGGELDGTWSAGCGVDSWDGSVPGVIGDPLLDPYGSINPGGEAPGGIGLVRDGVVGAYLLEDTGDPRDFAWLDPSNRSILLGRDLGLEIPESGHRNLLRDGVTLRARFRLTPPARIVDVVAAPKGGAILQDGTGMFTLVHAGGLAPGARAECIGFSLDVNPVEPETGLLHVGQGPSAFAVPVLDPTHWLDVWLTISDPDPADESLSLRLYVNGDLDPSVSIDDWIPTPSPSRIGSCIGAVNSILMGLPSTPDSASVEVDLLAVLDGAFGPAVAAASVAFHRGDLNDDGVSNLTDAVMILGYLFLGEGDPSCLEAADIDDDGEVNLTDAVGLLVHLFSGGPPPARPGPPGYPCGYDPPGSPDLGCLSFRGCASPGP